MSEANPDRGEHELPLGRRTYLLRPSFAAITAIERKTERALPELIRMGNSGTMPLAIAGIVAAELVKAGAGDDDLTRRVSAAKMGEMIFERGIAPAVARLTLCLLDAATGGRDAQGEAKAVATQTDEDDATAE
ncbi:conserved hypothetical protein [Altererythrobacter sp. B11]|uniref:hypothetical protein n=1 Tax=Altererythrobacter sp. B11 TaxID=2060312 RepID=UPI000DC6E317|nr:hypothetical protein [Altererythrobacter sp. B11]BBC72922.1 conserved hypothetical protein [Altererythrobacter sp. B11]